ncbi:hypothetical protein N5C16_00600 [Stenotrophomonas sp. GD03908]|uniref:hypothetical protein n=1 Tax=Stenotrophomonas sp. GD03908 TaxID=2975403 RepID=UPI00244C889D|nr:hypothetical protein [Stenotrophomonas sp. GD03908]MDH0977765.1 hypothetical protein [Stenotrophomonas sp. GD03908]
MDFSDYKTRSRLTVASNLGYIARLDRKPITSCPFDEGTDADQDEHRRQGRAA